MEKSENLHIQVGTQYHEIYTYLYLYSIRQHVKYK
jgi:hypothetical protein